MDSLALVCRHTEGHIARKILRIFEDSLAGRRCDPFDRGKALALEDRYVVGCRQRRMLLHDADAAGIGRLAICIHDLAVLEVGKADGAVIAPRPAPVAADGLRRSVRQRQLQLRQQLCLRAEGVRLPCAAVGAAVPAVRQLDGHGVFAAPQQVRHIVDLILDALAVVRGAGRQQRVPDAPAVEPRLIQAAGRKIQPGLLNLSRGKHLAEAIHRVALLFTDGIVPRDPQGAPVRSIQKPHFEKGLARPRAGIVVLIPEPHAPADALPGSKRVWIIRVHGAGGHLPAVPYRTAIRRCKDLECALRDPVLTSPEQPRMRNINAQRVLQIFRF